MNQFGLKTVFHSKTFKKIERALTGLKLVLYIESPFLKTGVISACLKIPAKLPLFPQSLEVTNYFLRVNLNPVNCNIHWKLKCLPKFTGFSFFGSPLIAVTILVSLD